MKKTMFGLAMCALFLASCSNDPSVGESTAVNPDQINFITSTTRAQITDLPALQSSTAGFVVYATSGSAPTGWFAGIDGTNNYRYNAGNWGWAGVAPQWPTTVAGYPMNFYAYFASSYTGFTPSVTAPSVLMGEYTIQAEAQQVDFLAAKTSTASKPASGQLTMTFNHILSKINFQLVPGYGADVYLQSLNVNNVGNKRTYDFIASTWNAQPAAFTSSYIYKATAKPATKITGVDATELAALSVLPTNMDLMLMPQTAASWVPVSGVSPANAYMGFIYRIETASNPNAIGYKLANSHPNYSSLTPAEQSALNGKPLFVKAGYPFGTSPFTWDMGKGYTYNIQLGTAASMNGYLLDNRYYDENGNPVNLTINGKQPGDPVTPGTISFIVTVTNWNNSSSDIK